MSRKHIFIPGVLSLTLFIGACSKDDSGNKPEGEKTFITAGIGGKRTDLSVEAKAHQENANHISIVGYTAKPEPGKETSVIQLSVYNSAQKITAKTYDLDANDNYSVLVTFSFLKADGAQVNYTASEQSASAYDVFTIKITSIEGGYVKGTFGGKVVQQSGLTTTSTVEIADGEFSVPVK